MKNHITNVEAVVGKHLLKNQRKNNMKNLYHPTKDRWYHQNDGIKLNTIKGKTWATVGIITTMAGIIAGAGYFSQAWADVTTYNNDYFVKKAVAEKPQTVTMADETTQEAMTEIIKRVWRRDWKIGVAIASCESGLRPTAVNRNNKPPYQHQVDVGLFQVGVPVHKWSEEDMLNPVANAGFAYALYNEQGFGPWKSSEKCWRQRI